MKKTITIEGDVKVVTHSPSPNFDPLTASAAELVANCFPAVPQDQPHRQRFERVWARLKNKFHYIEPTFRVNPGKTHGPRHPSPTAGTQTSSNWSGAVVNPPAGQTFKYVIGDWVVPDVDAPAQGQWYYCANWIGIDGDGSGDVFQAGLQSEVYQSGSSITKVLYPWWEWFPASETQITNFPVSPGDMMIMTLCSANAAGSTTGTVYWTNATSGASTNATLTAPSGTKLVGNCAEWIVEGNGALADYGEVFFSDCEAVTNTGTVVDGGTQTNINMTQSGKVVSDGNLITPTIVQCVYV